MRIRIETMVPALVLIPLFAGAAVQAEEKAPGKATVLGVVTDSGGGPVSEAVVEVLDNAGKVAVSQKTNARGKYEIAVPAPGAYKLAVSVAGYRYAEIPVQIAGQPVTKNVPLDAFAFDAVVVTASRSTESVMEVPAAITVVGKDDIQDGRKALSLSESLREVPGIRVEDELGQAGRTRIIIRGVGTRANSPAGSGVRGVKVLVDGIPKNNAGGSAQDLTNIDLQSAERIEVLRGPASALYGNHSGGVVNVITEEGTGIPFVAYRQTAGQYGLFSEHIKSGGRIGDVSYFAAAHRDDQDGFRRQSAFASTGFNGKVGLIIDDRSNVTAVIGYDRNFERSPGPLTEAQFNADARQPDATFLANDVRAVTEDLRVGAIYRRQMYEYGSLELTGYYAPRHLGPFQQIGVRIPQDFTNRGANGRYLHTQPFFGLANRFTFGSEFQDTPITTGVFNSTTGAASSLLEEHASTFGAYALDELSLLPQVSLTLAGRFDWIRFTSEDLTKAKGVNQRVYRKWTPKAGLTFRPLDTISLYATFSQGLEAPIIGELRITKDGSYGFNGDLTPQTSNNYEIGGRGSALDGRVGFEIAAFRQDVKDFISPSGSFPNNFFQNVGDVREYGLELAVRFKPFRDVTVGGAYTYSDFTFSRYVNANNDFTGNRLPGVPEHVLVGELKYQTPIGITLGGDVRTVSPFFFNDANGKDFKPTEQIARSNARYTVVDLRAGYEYKRGKFGFNPFLSVYNVTDTKYSEFALINDAGRRFYNPLPGINVFGGIGISYDML